MKAFYTELHVNMRLRFKALPDYSYYQYHVAESASFGINTQNTHFVFCIALAGSNTRISI